MLQVGIVGATGYTGAELMKLILRHPQARLRAVTSRADAGAPVSAMFPSLRGQTDICFQTSQEAGLDRCDVVFFATPHGVSLVEAPPLLEAGVRVIDLGADFRLKNPAVYQQWYGIEHTSTQWLARAVYGLVEINREQIKQAKLVGMAGCYPTAVQLGFLPLLKRGLINTDNLVADCKSGVSGAGRKAEIALLHTEVHDNFRAYAVSGHRHLPEIKQGLVAMTDEPIGLTFVPHLVPMIRGIHATLYATLKPEHQQVDIQAVFEETFFDEYFVDILPAGQYPQTRFVRGTNRVQIAVERPQNGNTVVVMVVEDNLVKGASGQAVQAMNVMFGLPETMGLEQIANLP